MKRIALAEVIKKIRQAELDYHRTFGSVQLLAVSKGRCIESIQLAAAAGLHAFGENYLQEALNKIQVLRALDLQWHFIGTLQANKTRAVAENFAWVHSVNRVKIAERLSRHRPESLPALNVCLEVNISHEASKSGASVSELLPLAAAVQSLPNLKLRGLMVIPERLSTFQDQVDLYREVYNLQNQLNAQGFNLDTLSMGTSHDFEAAIAAGSTLVRIGAAIFEEE